MVEGRGRDKREIGRERGGEEEGRLKKIATHILEQKRGLGARNDARTSRARASGASGGGGADRLRQDVRHNRCHRCVVRHQARKKDLALLSGQEAKRREGTSLNRCLLTNHVAIARTSAAWPGPLRVVHSTFCTALTKAASRAWGVGSGSHTAACRSDDATALRGAHMGDGALSRAQARTTELTMTCPQMPPPAGRRATSRSTMKLWHEHLRHAGNWKQQVGNMATLSMHSSH